MYNPAVLSTINRLSTNSETAGSITGLTTAGGVTGSGASKLTILDSAGVSYSVSRAVLDSLGVSYTVTNAVLDSSGSSYTVI